MPALAIYVGAMVWLSTFIIEVHFLLDLLFFTIAGLAWICLLYTSPSPRDFG